MKSLFSIKVKSAALLVSFMGATAAPVQADEIFADYIVPFVKGCVLPAGAGYLGGYGISDGLGANPSDRRQVGRTVAGVGCLLGGSNKVSNHHDLNRYGGKNFGVESQSYRTTTRRTRSYGGSWSTSEDYYRSTPGVTNRDN